MTRFVYRGAVRSLRPAIGAMPSRTEVVPIRVALASA